MAKAKTPKGNKVMRNLKFKLSDHEKAERGFEAASLNQDLAKVLIEKKTVSDQFSARIKTFTSKINVLLKEIHTGTELRETECIEVKNFDDNKVEYWLDGEMRESREMTEADKQMEMKVDTKKKKFQKPAIVPDEKISEKRKYIARVHREETGKNTSKSVLSNGLN